MSHITCFVTQECVIDKKVGKIMFMRQSLLQKLFQVDMDDKLGQYRSDKLGQYDLVLEHIFSREGAIKTLLFFFNFLSVVFWYCSLEY